MHKAGSSTYSVCKTHKSFINVYCAFACCVCRYLHVCVVCAVGYFIWMAGSIPFGTTGMTGDDQLFLLLISSKLFSAHKHKRRSLKQDCDGGRELWRRKQCSTEGGRKPWFKDSAGAWGRDQRDVQTKIGPEMGRCVLGLVSFCWSLSHL